MSKMIQVRNVPDELHRTLKVRAAERGMSLSDFLLAELEAIAEQPTMPELLDWLDRQPGAEIGDDAVEIIRAHRGPLP
jgi:plasmid stability protein